MAVKVNTSGSAQARRLIRAGKVDSDSTWDFSASDGNALLGDAGDDWGRYGSAHLAVDAKEATDTKARYKYPFGKLKNGSLFVFRSALMAIRQRAGQQNQRDIFDAAGSLLDEMGEKMKVKARSHAEHGGEGIQFVVGRLKGEDTTTVQTVLFDKESWDEDDASEWLDDHEFNADKVDETEDKLRFRQREPGEFEEGSFRTIDAGSHMKKTKKMAEKDDDEPDLRVIEGIEVFRTGTWNGDRYTEKDLTDIVEAFPKAGFEVPLKVGHAEKSGSPAYGWIRNLRKEGAKLVADFVDLPKKIYDAIRRRAYNSVSAEIFWNLKRGDKTFRRALKAVALLGAEIPAVADLKPLREVVNSIASEDYELVAVHSFNISEDEDMDKVQELTVQVGDLTSKLAKAKTDYEELAKKLAKAEEDKDKMDEDEMGPMMDRMKKDMAALKKQMEALTVDKKNAEESLSKAVTEKDEAIKSLQTQIETLTKFKAESEERERQRFVEEKAKACSIPVIRTHVKALYDLATKHPAEKIAIFSVDGKSEEMATVDVLDRMVKVMNDKFAKLFTELSEAGKVNSDFHASENPDKEIDALARKKIAADPKLSYSEAVKAIMQDPEHAALAKAYNQSQRS